MAIVYSAISAARYFRIVIPFANTRMFTTGRQSVLFATLCSVEYATSEDTWSVNMAGCCDCFLHDSFASVISDQSFWNSVMSFLWCTRWLWLNFRYLSQFRRKTIYRKCTNSPTFPSLHQCHSSFSNPSFALPTSQLILQPFFCFSYITCYSLTSPGEPPMQRTSVI